MFIQVGEDSINDIDVWSSRVFLGFSAGKEEFSALQMRDGWGKQNIYTHSSQFFALAPRFAQNRTETPATQGTYYGNRPRNSAWDSAKYQPLTIWIK